MLQTAEWFIFLCQHTEVIVRVFKVIEPYLYINIDNNKLTSQRGNTGDLSSSVFSPPPPPPPPHVWLGVRDTNIRSIILMHFPVKVLEFSVSKLSMSLCELLIQRATSWITGFHNLCCYSMYLIVFVSKKINEKEAGGRGYGLVVLFSGSPLRCKCGVMDFD